MTLETGSGINQEPSSETWQKRNVLLLGLRAHVLVPVPNCLALVWSQRHRHERVAFSFKHAHQNSLLAILLMNTTFPFSCAYKHMHLDALACTLLADHHT